VTTTLYFVRHTEVHNPRDLFYGRLPRFRISTRGREQADRVADYLAEDPITMVYTSPMLRARQTAQAIAARHPGVPLRRNALITEIGTGWQGIHNPHVPKGTSFFIDQWPGDETVADVIARMSGMVRLVLRRHAGQQVVCVSHADPIAILTLWAGGTEVTPELLMKPVAPARGAISVFEYPTPSALPILSYINPQDPEPEPPPQTEAQTEEGSEATAPTDAEGQALPDAAAEAAAPLGGNGALPSRSTVERAGTRDATGESALSS